MPSSRPRSRWAWIRTAGLQGDAGLDCARSVVDQRPIVQIHLEHCSVDGVARSGRSSAGRASKSASTKSPAQARPGPWGKGPRGDRKPGFDHAAAPWYSWISPPSRSRRRTSRGLTGIGSDASARGWARPRARWGRPRLSCSTEVRSVRSRCRRPLDDGRVEALGPGRLDHALGVGIGVRCREGRHDHPGPILANDLVERPAELRGPVADEEPDGARPSVEVGREVPDLLR
jgi:hypothetical protein